MPARPKNPYESLRPDAAVVELQTLVHRYSLVMLPKRNKAPNPDNICASIF